MQKNKYNSEESDIEAEHIMEGNGMEKAMVRGKRWVELQSF